MRCCVDRLNLLPRSLRRNPDEIRLYRGAENAALRTSVCNLLKVSPAGYYEWRGRPLSSRAIADVEIRSAIVRVHAESRRTYGRPRIHAKLSAEGRHVGAKRVRRLMKAAGIAGTRPRRFRKTTDSNHGLPVAKNVLARAFDVKQITQTNQVYAGDITYVPTREGWLYLAVVLDLVSRRVIGRSMDSSMDRKLVITALRSAMTNRRPKRGTLFHSDRGSQYASAEFTDFLALHGIIASMSRKGDCWDNAVVESFFGSMKTELGVPIFESRSAARAAIFEYIEVWYDRKRLHSTLDYVCPEQYESSLPKAA